MKNSPFFHCLICVLLGSSLFFPTLKAQITFVPNEGQWEDQVIFRTDLPSYSLFFEKNDITYAFYAPHACHGPKCSHSHGHPGRGHAIRVHFANASQPRFHHEKAINGYLNFYKGKDPSKWAAHVPRYPQFSYQSLYPGIDMKWYKDAGRLKYDFILEPEADAKQIQLIYEGALGMVLDTAGNLRILTSVGEVIEEKPIAYQWEKIPTGDSVKVNIPCLYVLENNSLSFSLPQGYDKSKSLIIDPTLVFGTYSGATTTNWGFTATYDQKGNAYGGGIIFSQGYPTTLGAFQNTHQGGVSDVTISKFSPDGSQLIFATYLGGNAAEQPHSMVTGAHNELFVFGRTFSDDFPVTNNAYDTTANGLADLYITKLDSNGLMLASTYLGGTNDDGIIYRGFFGAPRASFLYFNYGDDARGEIELDDRGNCYIATVTASQDFPIASLPVKSFSGMLDACIAKLNPDLSELRWSSYFGGSGDDAVVSIAVVKEDELYVTGSTESADFPVTADAYEPNFQGNIDCFVAKMDLKQSQLTASTFIGSDSLDASFFVELDKSKDVYIYGQTLGDIGHINAPYFQREAKQFITKLNPDLSQLYWQAPFGTLFSPLPDISPTAFLVDNCYRIYVAGWGPVNFNRFQGIMPLSANAFQDTTEGSHFYLGVFEKDMDSLIYGTYFGEIGGEDEHVDGGTSRFDKRGIIYQAVCASCGGSSDFPTTAGAYSRQNGAGQGGIGASGCNMALYKFDFELPSVFADFVPENDDSQAVFQGCTPLTINFNNTTAVSGQASFSWDFGDGSPVQSTQSPTYTFTQKGIYQVQLIVNDPTTCNQNDTVIKTIQVFTDAFADAGPDTSICSGDSILLQANAPAGLQVQWSNAISLSNDTLLNPWAKPSETTTYILHVSDHAQCADEDTVTVTVDPQTELTTLNDTAICLGSSLVMWSIGANQVKWSPTAPINNPFSPSPVARPQENTRFQLIGNPSLCPDTAYVQIDVIDAGTTAAFVEKNPVCAGELAWMQASGGERYLWGNGWRSSRIGPRLYDTTAMVVTAYTGDCPAVPDTVHVDVVPIPVANFIAVRQSNHAPVEVFLKNNSVDAVRYFWDVGIYHTRRFDKELTVVYRDTGTYSIKLRAYNELGCEDQSTYTFFVLPTTLELPSAFSPNGDQVNDRYFIPSFGFERMDFRVFDRWGNEIFRALNPDFRWDGKHKGQDVPEGVYVYQLEAIGLNGQLYERKGTITIIR